VYQVEGEPEQILPAGSAFHEPAGAIIAEFGNASDSEPMKFVAFYLLNGEQDLIEMFGVMENEVSDWYWSGGVLKSPIRTVPSLHRAKIWTSGGIVYRLGCSSPSCQ
jgi:hypothetical protein